MVEDGTWLKIGEVVERLSRYPGYNEDRVRRLADAGYIRSIRPPSTGPGRAHRRFEAASVDELAGALALPAAEQDAALAAIRRRNQGGDTSGPVPTEETGPERE